MKTFLFTIFLLVTQLCSSQTETNISIFHRLILINQSNEIMVVKIAEAGFWVTPGFYQTDNKSIKDGIKDMVSSYGYEIVNWSLNGVFILNREINDQHSTSLRNVYLVNLGKGNQSTPEGIEEIAWLKWEQAIELITFPHINLMIQQIMNDTKRNWGGTLQQYKEGMEWKVKVIEEFYTLSK